MYQSRPTSIAVLTFRRPVGLTKALASLLELTNHADPSCDLIEVMVIDNDPDASARPVVESHDSLLVRYVHEPLPGVSAARNRALSEASGARLVFIDDDEFAGPDWPNGLLRVMDQTGAALVGGPVRSVLPVSAPAWVSSIGIFDRDEPEDGSELDWLRSGNLAIDLDLVRSADLWFEESFGSTGGEDVRFSVQARRKGLGLRWSATAIVYEDVPSERLTSRWIEARARTGMVNYVRAHAPITPAVASRILIRAGGRLITGVATALAGVIGSDEKRLLRGKIALARVHGAVIGISSALGEERTRRAIQTGSSARSGR